MAPEKSLLANLLGTVLDGFKGLLDGFVRTLIVWFILVGLAGAVLFVLKPGPFAAESWHKVSELVATVLLTGAAFEGLVKSMQYSGLFKDELHKLFLDADFLKAEKKRVFEAMSAREARDYLAEVITNPPVLSTHEAMFTKVISDAGFVERQRQMLLEIIYHEDFLKNRKDLDKFWTKMTEVVYANYFPEISSRIANRVLKDYFPKEDNFYYDKFVETLIIRSHKNGHHIELDDTTTFLIKAIDPSQKITWSYQDVLRKDFSDTITTTQLDELRVDGKDKIQESGLKIDTSEDKTTITLKCSLSLENSREYKFRVHERKIYDPLSDPTIYFTNKRFINTLELNVDYPVSEFELIHTPIGIRPDEDDTKTKGDKFWYEYKDLLFPYQGYRLTLRRRTTQP